MKNAKNKTNKMSAHFERFSGWVTKAAGSTPAFIGAVALVVAWAATGPIFQ